MTDKRAGPKDRRYPQLWQAFQWWDELMQMRKKHLLRLSSIDHGKSNRMRYIEMRYLEQINELLEGMTDDAGNKLPGAEEQLALYGKEAGPVWDWLTAIKGIGDHTAAKLIALFDDPGKFDTISKWWRYAGYGRYEYWVNGDGTVQCPRDGYKSFKAKGGEWVFDGTVVEKGYPGARKAEKEEVIREHVVPVPEPGWHLETRNDRRLSGWNLPYNNRLKSECYLVTASFIKQQTPLYSEFYYEKKGYYRAKHPEPLPNPNGPQKRRYTDQHIHLMAMRKVTKLFLSHFWLKWREFDGLPVTDPYVSAVMGHTNIIPPPEFE